MSGKAKLLLDVVAFPRAQSVQPAERLGRRGATRSWTTTLSSVTRIGSSALTKDQPSPVSLLRTSAARYLRRTTQWLWARANMYKQDGQRKEQTQADPQFQPTRAVHSSRLPSRARIDLRVAGHVSTALSLAAAICTKVTLSSMSIPHPRVSSPCFSKTVPGRVTTITGIRVAHTLWMPASCQPWSVRPHHHTAAQRPTAAVGTA